MTEQCKSQYQSYLLRLWRVGEGQTYRMMLERVDSHERHGFADLEELCAFLREQTRPTTGARSGVTTDTPSAMDVDDPSTADYPNQRYDS